MTVHQSLFIAPCSHVFHYKCIRPLLESHHPAFSCPLCRTFADLEQDVEVDLPLVDLDDASAVGDNEAEARERGVETEVELDHIAPGQSSTLRGRRMSLMDENEEESEGHHTHSHHGLPAGVAPPLSDEEPEIVDLADEDMVHIISPRSHHLQSPIEVDGEDGAMVSDGDVDGDEGLGRANDPDRTVGPAKRKR